MIYIIMTIDSLRKNLYIILKVLTLLFLADTNAVAKDLEITQSTNKSTNQKQMLIRIPWGAMENERTPSTGWMYPTYDYFSVTGNSIFIEDIEKKQILYFKDGIYQKSFGYNPYLFGLIATNDILYLFDESGKAVALSIPAGQVLFSKYFLTFKSRGTSYIYKYGKVFVLTINHPKRGTEIFSCLDLKLRDVECPSHIQTRDENRFSYGYRYIQPNLITDSEIYNRKFVIVKLLHQDTLDTVRSALYENKSSAETQQPYIYDIKGLYDAVDTKKGVEIWFTPWKAVN